MAGVPLRDQPGEAPEHRGPLEHEQGSTAAGRGGKKPLIAASSESCVYTRSGRGTLCVSRGSGRAFGDPLLRRPPTYSRCLASAGFQPRRRRADRAAGFLLPLAVLPRLAVVWGPTAATAYRSLRELRAAAAAAGPIRSSRAGAGNSSAHQVGSRSQATARASRSRTRTPRRRLPRSGRASGEQIDAAIARRSRRLSRVGPDARGRARGDAARGRDAAPSAHGRARRGDDARGRQAAGRELRRGRLDRGLLRLLRRDRPRLRRAGDPADRVEPAQPRRQGAARRGRLHRPVELPAAPARLEAGTRARGGQRGRRQALGAHARSPP